MSEELKRRDRVTILAGVNRGKSGTVTQVLDGGKRVGVLVDGASAAQSLAAKNVKP